MGKKSIILTNPPIITLRKMHTSSFAFEGQYYPLVTAPTSIFKSAVREAYPSFNPDGAMGRLLEQDELDILDRWFILCEVAKLHRPMELV